jgi:hypothetical protein
MADIDDAAQWATQGVGERIWQSQRDRTGNPFAPPPGFVDLDPSTTHDPRPLLTAVRTIAGDLDPQAVGSIYQTSDGVIHLGLTAAARPDLVQAASDAVPDARIETFAARYAWSELLAIADEITDAMVDNRCETIVSIGAIEHTSTVRVGCTDLDSPAAKAIAAWYLDAVELVPDQAYEPLARGQR